MADQNYQTLHPDSTSSAGRPDPAKAASTPGESGSGEQSVGDQAQALAGQAQDKAQEVAGQVHDTAQEVAGQARAQFHNQIEQLSAKAAEQINQQASDLRTVSQSLREQGKDGPAKSADRLGGYAERAGGYLRDKNADQLLQDAEELGRKRPWAVAGAGAVLGLAASRFLKASARERYAARSAGPPPPASPVTSSAGTSGPGVGASSPAGTPLVSSPGVPLAGRTPEL